MEIQKLGKIIRTITSNEGHYYINVSKASVTKALKILEEDSYIRRTLDKNNRRNVLCYVTERKAVLS